jgi:hypothetical protein
VKLRIEGNALSVKRQDSWRCSTLCNNITTQDFRLLHKALRQQRARLELPSVYSPVFLSQRHEMTRPKHNPDARDSEDVLGTDLPDTVSAATWNRPYNYFVVRTDEGRLSRLDDHERGRIIVHGFSRRDTTLSATKLAASVSVVVSILLATNQTKITTDSGPTTVK